MRKLNLALVATTLGFGLFAAVAPASAAPAEPKANHGQCVSSSEQPSGKGGRSATAKDKQACETPPPAPLTCTTNGTATRDSAANTVTVTGQVGTPGSSLECQTSIAVTGGTSTISFDYVISGAEGCGGGVPRLFVQIGSDYFNTFDSNTTCSGQGSSGTITYVIPVTGTVTTVGFVYDRNDNGSVVYSNATVGGVVLDV